MAGSRSEADNVAAQGWRCDISRKVVHDGGAILRFKYLELGELGLARSVIGENAQFGEFRFRGWQFDQLFGPGFLATRFPHFRETIRRAGCRNPDFDMLGREFLVLSVDDIEAAGIDNDSVDRGFAALIEGDDKFVREFRRLGRSPANDAGATATENISQAV